ncbi:MAG: hypothetical protein Q7L07_08175 [Pseudohongiella sp.]|nr:hypothetical protein [Pseudohongiella sp.]
METILQKVLSVELKSAQVLNRSSDLILTAIGMLLFAILLLITSEHGYWGAAIGSLYVWHRYVVLEFAHLKNTFGAQCVPNSDGPIT